ncbi:MAG: hypothetical protein IKF06_07490 [Lachnospiraceae bacterium]|nr:hypothetical protein [Lachnospiraceae bacterium]
MNIKDYMVNGFMIFAYVTVSVILHFFSAVLMLLSRICLFLDGLTEFVADLLICIWRNIFAYSKIIGKYVGRESKTFLRKAENLIAERRRKIVPLAGKGKNRLRSYFDAIRKKVVSTFRFYKEIITECCRMATKSSRFNKDEENTLQNFFETLL